MRRDRKVATRLRREGKSYGEIKGILGIPKGTLSYWFRNFEIPKRTKQELIKRSVQKWRNNIIAYNKRRAIVARENAKRFQEEAAKEMPKVADSDLMMLGAALYWAEGSKKRRWTVDFSNTDPAMIKFIMKFFRKTCSVSEDKFDPWIQIHPNVSAGKATRYWAEITGIEKRKFRIQSLISKSSKRKRLPNTLPYGTLHIRIHSGRLTNRIKGWILGLSRQA